MKDPGDSPEAQAVSNLLEGRIGQAVEQLEALAKAQPETASQPISGQLHELKGELALAHTSACIRMAAWRPNQTQII